MVLVYLLILLCDCQRIVIEFVICPLEQRPKSNQFNDEMMMKVSVFID